MVVMVVMVVIVEAVEVVDGLRHLPRRSPANPSACYPCPADPDDSQPCCLLLAMGSLA